MQEYFESTKFLNWLQLAGQLPPAIDNRQFNGCQASKLHNLINNHGYINKNTSNSLVDYSFLTTTDFAVLFGQDNQSQGSHYLPSRDYSEDALRAVLVNGRLVTELSTISTLPTATIICNLAEAIHNHPELVMQYLIRKDNDQPDPMVEINDALVSDGLFVYIPPNTQLPELNVLAITTVEQPQIFINMRHIIIVGENSQLTITEEYHASNAQVEYLNNIVLDIDLENNASLNYYKLQNESPVAQHFSTLFMHQKQHSSANIYCGLLGSKLGINTCNFTLQESFAQCQFQGFYGLSQEKQLIGTNIFMDHQASDTKSNISFNGVVANNAHAIFQAKVLVRPEISRVSAQQANHNIVLGNLAEVTSKPELEIYADDVKCRHGATVGQIDENAVFYFGSRGINRQDAISIILHAFMHQTLTSVNLSWFKSIMQQEWLERTDGC